MIARTRPTINTGISRAPMQLLAVGSYTNGDRELRARSLFQPRDIIEHRVARWTEEKWVAEVRTNGRLDGRSIFTGEFAEEDAIAWCQGLAPHANKAAYSASLAAAIAAVPDVTPFMLGTFDAETGKLCQPHTYYTRDGDVAEYVEGYNIVTRETVLIAAQTALEDK